MSRAASILVLDDDAGVVEWVVDALREESYRAQGVTSARKALELLSRPDFDVLVSDVQMPELKGLDLLRAIHEKRPEQLVILITAFGSIDLAVQAVRAGASDFLAKPFRIEALTLSIERALRERQMRREIVRLREAAVGESSSDLIAKSAAMKRVLDICVRAAQSDLPVLLTGESGAGKGALARKIHEQSPRREKPFVQINCAALPSTLAESELFGVKRGAFTDARDDRAGVFQQAHAGTLFLDEIGELTLDLQPKLLQVLEGKSVRPLGAAQELRIDVRLIAATNRSLEEGLRDRSFRADLYHRLNVIRIEVPPLRERMDDIPALVDRILNRIERRMERPPVAVAPDAMRWLSAQRWPGNVRELINAVERAVALSNRDLLGIDDFAPLAAPDFADPIETAASADWSLVQLERAYIRRVLQKTGGNKAQAARILGLDRRTLYRKAAELDAGAADSDTWVAEERSSSSSNNNANKG
jgi:DNA-binding NtrC family response regulator